MTHILDNHIGRAIDSSRRSETFSQTVETFYVQVAGSPDATDAILAARKSIYLDYGVTSLLVVRVSELAAGGHVVHLTKTSGAMVETVTCTDCNGQGGDATSDCETCRGVGAVAV